MGEDKPADQLAVLKLFVENGQNVNAIGFNGRSILMKFVGFEHKEAVRYLLDKTAINLGLKLTGAVLMKGYTARAGESAIDIAKNMLKKMTGASEEDVGRINNMEKIVEMLGKVTSNTLNNFQF